MDQLTPILGLRGMLQPPQIFDHAGVETWLQPHKNIGAIS